ncbi:hypothetical protein NDU88_002340 [Pleurodeles waltl]|uniref:Uncharacterized protein n=1 Tax=Pleurodeles waltl TaxID=8319 RepID=A0AAV7T1Y4_PLEWA|nr:hypothetical protein NDU88_002340 [Pleurodeles waltl]
MGRCRQAHLRRRHRLTLPPPTRKEKAWRPIPFSFRGQQGSSRRFARPREYKNGEPRLVGGGERKEQE